MEGKTVAERVVEVLEKHGACTLEEIARHVGTSVANLYNYVGTLKKQHGVVKHQTGNQPAIYALGKDATPKRMDTPKAETKAVPTKANGNGHAAFAINEAGELGIEKDGHKFSLDGQEFERLRSFIERTEPVWKGA